jgi:hypothetical protein
MGTTSLAISWQSASRGRESVFYVQRKDVILGELPSYFENPLQTW